MKPIIIANWKMNLSAGQSIELATVLKESLAEEKKKEVVICPSFSALAGVGQAISGSEIKLGSQDIFWESRGAYTGEESPKFLRELDCRYALIGHSERRQYLLETDEMTHLKVKAGYAANLTPILCVGETFAERQEGQADNAIFRQVVRALSGIELTANEQLVIAYEPVWVIGSGRPIEAPEAEHAFRLIHHALLDFWPPAIIRNNIRIISGGSVDAGNAAQFTGLDHFAGFLVGGASLKAEEFTAIINKF